MLNFAKKKGWLKTILSNFRLLFASDYINFVPDELHRPVSSGKKREIPAHTDIMAGVKFCSALPDDNHPGLHDLPAGQLDSSVLCVAVSSVFGRALSFFMCHIFNYLIFKIIQTP